MFNFNHLFLSRGDIVSWFAIQEKKRIIIGIDYKLTKRINIY